VPYVNIFFGLNDKVSGGQLFARPLE